MRPVGVQGEESLPLDLREVEVPVEEVADLRSKLQ